MQARSLMIEPRLPLTVRSIRRRRQLGGLMIAIALAGAPLAELWAARTWWERFIVVLLSAQVLAAGLSRAVSGIRLTSPRPEGRGFPVLT